MGKPVEVHFGKLTTNDQIEDVLDVLNIFSNK